jgi:hypothetical protein
MNTQASESRNPASNKKFTFLLIILPLIITILLEIIFILSVFSNSTKNQFLLENWANISSILISLFLLLPGLIFLATLIAFIFLLKKFQPAIEKGLKKTQTVSANLNDSILAIVRVVLFPYSIAKTLIQNGKVENSTKEDSIDE